MTEDKQKIELVMSDRVVPSDMLVYTDPVYGQRVFTRKNFEYEERTKHPLQPLRTHTDRKYVMTDSASFIAAVKKYGDATKGIVFYVGNHGENNTKVTMFFDEDSREEHIQLPLSSSLEFRSFLNGKEKTFNQKDFLKLVDTFPECIVVDGSVSYFRAMAEKLQISTKIDFESNVDPDNLTFIFQEKSGGDQAGKLPKKIKLSLPFYEGSTNKVEIDVDLEVTTPKNEGEKPMFKLVNVKHERTEREALKSEISTLQLALSDWLFVNGS